MTPTNQYPQFVADQVLTSDNLNDLFDYLDGQDRITRINLIGTGIVCGLIVETASGGSSITITKGTGITSEGYLVAVEEDAGKVYTEYVNYDPTKALVYGKFKPIAGRTIQLWELREAGASADDSTNPPQPLTPGFLNGGGVDDNVKVVMLYVELLQQDNKNCSPESCDDKGITVTVNLRPLLVRKTDVAAFGLALGMGSTVFSQTFQKLPNKRMIRFDVINTNVVTTADLFTAYKRILTTTFLDQLEKVLTGAWAQYKTIIIDEYENSNPFQGLSASVSYINDGTIDVTELQNLQYCYDFLSDLHYAYDEFRRTSMEVFHTCCPDSTLFPQHLLLDLAVPDLTSAVSQFRHYFNYSPLFQKEDLYGRLRSLFHRLALMTKEFKVPAVQGDKDNVDAFLRITPSRLDASAISLKAIPYYYDLDQDLYAAWNYEKTKAGEPDSNLSYHAKERSNAGDLEKEPLKYDLEPCNFLRIEGHVGKLYDHVLSNIQMQIDQYRLPIDVIALALGMDASGTNIADSRYLQEIQLQFEVLRNEVLCCLKKQLPYWSNLEVTPPVKGSTLPVSIINGVKFAVPAKAISLAVAASSVLAPVVSLPVSVKGQFIQAQSSSYTDSSIATQYLKYQVNGDFQVNRIPDPDPVFDANTISHYALIILDEISAIAVLLNSETLDALDVSGLTTHSQNLNDAAAKLGQLIDQRLQSQRSIQTIKAYVSAAKYPQVDRIDAAMSSISAATADTLTSLVLNQSDQDLENMVRLLESQTGKATQQSATITDFSSKLNRTDIPAAKDVAIVDDPVLVEMKNQLRGFACLCGLAGFKEMQTLLQKLVDQLRQANLFSVFSKKHPGLQHKAGVTMGGTFIVVYHQQGEKSPNKPDPVYEDLSNKLPAGTVVADFYIPYVCCSNESPIVFQIGDTNTQPTTATLSLQPNPQTNTLDYSIGDEKQYAFSHTPDNGTLNNGTDANGVTATGSDTFVFTPSKVQGLGPSEKLDLTFSYTKKGVTSSDLKVSVYALPTVSITGPASTDVLVGDKLSFASTVQFAKVFSWTLTDSAGKSTVVATTNNLDNFAASAAGVFTISLAVTQPETGEQAISNSIKITVKQPVKTCGSLADIVNGFTRLATLDTADNFKAFQTAILDPLAITAFFKTVSANVSSPVDTQLAFFNQTVQDNIGTWLGRVAAIIQNSNQKNIRLLSLELYRLLVDLDMYIACIQKTDQTVNITAFGTIVIQLQGASTGAPGILDLFAGLAAKEQASLKQLGTDIDAESKRQAANDRIQTKPNYTKALQALLTAFKKIS